MVVQAQRTKFVSVTPPAAIVDDASFVTAEIDTQGFEYAVIKCYIGATDIAMVALAVQESAVSGSGFVNVSGLVYGTSTDISGAVSALPSGTDDDSLFIFEIDLRGRERFLDVVATAGDGVAGTFASIWCELSRADELPITAAQKGLGNALRV